MLVLTPLPERYVLEPGFSDDAVRQMTWSSLADKLRSDTGLHSTDPFHARITEEFDSRVECQTGHLGPVERWAGKRRFAPPCGGLKPAESQRAATWCSRCPVRQHSSCVR